MNFSKALELMKQGKKVVRKNWTGYSIFVADNAIWVYYFTGMDAEVYWEPNTPDILADDWEVSNFVRPVT